MGGYKDAGKQREIVKRNFVSYVDRLGRVPTYNELRKTPEGYKYLSASSIERNFGSYSSLLSMLNMEGSKQPNQFNNIKTFTDSQILESVMTVCKESGRFDCTYYHKNRDDCMPGLKAIKLHFGTWRKMLSRLPIKLKNHILSRKMVLASDGHICDSVQESRVDDWLFERSIRHIVHKQYPGSGMVMDFFLPDYNMVIEYAGLYNISNTQFGREKKLKYRIKLRDKALITASQGWDFLLIKPDSLDNLSDVIKI